MNDQTKQALQSAYQALWTCREHNKLHFGETHNTVIEADKAYNAVHKALAQPQEALQDIVTYGQHISIGGERIDPSDFYLKPEQPQVSLLDSDGENKAVRCFLMLYGSKGLTVGKMRQHMTRCGYPLWPDVVADTHEDAHLTKAEAQTWIRHLLALAQPQGEWIDLTDEEVNLLVKEAA